jgi:hypothetical protein
MSSEKQHDAGCTVRDDRDAQEHALLNTLILVWAFLKRGFDGHIPPEIVRDFNKVITKEQLLAWFKSSPDSLITHGFFKDESQALELVKLLEPYLQQAPEFRGNQCSVG